MPKKFFELPQERQDAILNAALQEFAARGFDVASTNIIAKKAGLSKALMFHYVKNKSELFFLVYDYFSDLLQQDYYQQLDFSEKDIFARLHQSYLLQIGLLTRYPALLNFDKLAQKTKSEEINQALQTRQSQNKGNCAPSIFEDISTDLFRPELDLEKSKQFILWTNQGFTQQLLTELRNESNQPLNQQAVLSFLDDYLAELRKLFYQTN